MKQGVIGFWKMESTDSFGEYDKTSQRVMKHSLKKEEKNLLNSIVDNHKDEDETAVFWNGITTRKAAVRDHY